MTFSYDEADDFDETDDFDESQDSLLDEEDDDSVDLENPSTALSQAFHEATAEETIEEDYEDEKEDAAEEEDEVEEEGGAEEEDEVEGEDDAEEIGDAEEEDAAEGEDDVEEEGDDTESYEQPLAEAIDALPDEEDLEADLTPLELPPLEVEPFRPEEASNYAYADAVTAYYEEKDYQQAIEKFGEAIENEAQHAEGTEASSNEIVAKAMYWQAEAYVKMQDIPQAIGTFESLVQTCQGHYLVLAAQRRTDELNEEDS